MEVVYNTIGRNYNSNRSADPHILDIIRELLDLPVGSVIADIGAGTGNYANALANNGYFIKAVEPSEEMIKQSKPNKNVDWFQGTAEDIPLDNASVNGVIVILAIHHFSDIKRAAREIARICPKGPLVIFTLDPQVRKELWFEKYFPEINLHVIEKFLPLSELIDNFVSICEWTAAIRSFPLPANLEDRFLDSVWNQPEMYLNTEVRQNISPFALTPPEVLNRRLSKLQADLKCGEWDRNFGYLRKCSHFDAGYKFLSFSNCFG